MIQQIAILFAMKDEARPLIDKLSLAECSDIFQPNLPMRCYQGQSGSIQLSVVLAGTDHRYQVDYIGSEAATLMAYETARMLSPDLIISAGTAGGFANKGADIGTIYVSDKCFIYHDRHVPIEGFSESSMGQYPSLPVNKMVKDLGFRKGIISTGSSLEKNEKDILLINQFDAVAKEMEAAAVAWVSMLLDLPMLAVKSITNLVDLDNQSETEFIANFHQASSSLTDALVQILGYMQNKSLEQLNH